MADFIALEARARILRDIRIFFTSRGLLEVETPVVLAYPSQEPELEPLRTTVRDVRGSAFPAFLRMSPEFSIKKLLADVARASDCAGVFEIGPVFRDREPWGQQHNPEFTMLEFYEIGKDYRALMETCEALLTALAPGRWPQPWERLTMVEAFARYAGLDLTVLLERDAMAAACAARGLTVTPSDTFDDCFFKVFLTDIEPSIGRERPTFLLDWPSAMAALAQRKAGDPRVAERVELYIGGLELGNGFTELTDSVEQRARFAEDQAHRHAAGREAFPVDEAFLAALDRMPKTTGMALGVDRIVMLLTGARTIDAVRWLPAGTLFATEHVIRR